MICKFPFGSCLASVLLFIPSALPAAPAFIPLGSETTVTAVSADGSTVCGSISGSPFYWTAAGGITMLPTTGSGGEASALSSDGTVIVGTLGARGVRWDNGVVTTLSGLSGTPFPFVSRQHAASGVSGDGTTVVGWSTTASRFQEAFRESDGTAVPLGTLSSNDPEIVPISQANAISADGSTIVGRTTSGAGSEAFRVRNGQMAGLGDAFGGAYSSTANAVSADGNVIVGTGSAGSSSGLPVSVALRWDGAAMALLPNPSGTTDGEALGISGDARIVAGRAKIDGPYHAATWEEGTGAKLLSDLLEEQGVTTGGLHLAEAVAVSADGDVIAGNSHNSRGGWVITGALALFGLAPPEPWLEIVKTGSAATLSFGTEPGFLYTVEKSTTLESSPWTPVGSLHSTAGATGPSSHQVTDTAAEGPRGFYRLQVEAAP